MANVVITTTTNGVNFDMGVYSTAIGFSKAFRLKHSLNRITRCDNWIEYLTDEMKTYSVHYTTNSYNAIIVDSIDGVAPTSLDDLYTKITAILG